MRRFLFAAVLALLAMSQARADLRILSSPGGYVGDYLQAFSRVRQSGERVIIDVPCFIVQGADFERAASIPFDHE